MKICLVLGQHCCNFTFVGVSVPWDQKRMESPWLLEQFFCSCLNIWGHPYLSDFTASFLLPNKVLNNRPVKQPPHWCQATSELIRMLHAILTCYRGQCLASKYDQREREACQLLHILQGPIGACSHTNTGNVKNVSKKSPLQVLKICHLASFPTPRIGLESSGVKCLLTFF